MHLDILEQLPTDLRDELVRSQIAVNNQTAESTRLANLKAQREISVLENLPDSHHTYLFYTGVDALSVNQCMKELEIWSRRDPGCPITIIFNSPGGYVNDGYALYDYLRELSKRGHKITTKCLGMAASMGAILMQAGDERVMGPTSFFMIHEIAGQLEGNSSQIEDQRKQLDRLENKALEILSSRSSLSKRTIQTRWKRRDWVMDAEEAVANGFADRVDS